MQVFLTIHLKNHSNKVILFTEFVKGMRNMKKIFALFLTILFVIGSFALTADAERGEFIADPDSLLSPESVTEINNICAALAESNGCEVYIYVAKTLGGQSCEAYSAKLFDSENIGGNERRGVVFVAASDDADYYMKAGAGVGNHLSYENIVSLLGEKFEPDFAAGEIDRATVSTMYSLCDRLSKLTEAELAKHAEEENKGANPFVIILLVILGVALLCILAFAVLCIRAQMIRKKRRQRRRRPAVRVYRR